jgi:hypothetical protein
MTPAYKAILRSVHPPWCKERLIMAVSFDLCAYFDESEDALEKVHAIGGFIAPTHEWDSLQDAWVARVKPTGVSAFHFTDCECGYGEFTEERGWKKEDRLNLIVDLIGLICRYNVYMIGCGVILDDYKGLPTPLGLDKWHFAFQAVLLEAALQAMPLLSEETVAFFFDWKNKQGNAQDLFLTIQQDQKLGAWRNRLGTLTFGHKEFNAPGSIPLLQIADVAAFETRKALSNPITHPDLKERISFQKLREAEKVGVIMRYDKNVLSKIWQSKKDETESLRR